MRYTYLFPNAVDIINEQTAPHNNHRGVKKCNTFSGSSWTYQRLGRYLWLLCSWPDTKMFFIHTIYADAHTAVLIRFELTDWQFHIKEWSPLSAEWFSRLDYWMSHNTRCVSTIDHIDDRRLTMLFTHKVAQSIAIHNGIPTSHWKDYCDLSQMQHNYTMQLTLIIGR